jgi:hypothetical protein
MALLLTRGSKAKPPVPQRLAALPYQLYGFRNNSGTLAIFTAIRRASSRVFTATLGQVI